MKCLHWHRLLFTAVISSVCSSAVKNQVTGSFILNAKGEETKSKTFIENGLEWEYSLSNDRESLKTIGPLHEGIVVLVSETQIWWCLCCTSGVQVNVCVSRSSRRRRTQRSVWATNTSFMKISCPSSPTTTCCSLNWTRMTGHWRAGHSVPNPAEEVCACVTCVWSCDD